jgi:hypothetical protein
MNLESVRIQEYNPENRSFGNFIMRRFMQYVTQKPFNKEKGQWQ